MRVQFLILTLLTFSILYAQEQIMSVHLKGGGSHSHRVAEVDSITFRSESGNTPPTTINANIFTTLKGYIGMSESQIQDEMAKLKGGVTRTDTEEDYGVDIEYVSIENPLRYRFMLGKNGRLIGVEFLQKKVPSEQGLSLVLTCSDALAAMAISGNRYFASWETVSGMMEFKNRNSFLDYFNSNKQNMTLAQEGTDIAPGVRALWSYYRQGGEIRIIVAGA